MSLSLERTIATCSVLFVLSLAACGNAKQDVPLAGGETYQLQSSGKLTVYPSMKADGASGSTPLQRLRVKRKNVDPAATQPGRWRCTDCICNSGDCSCSECSSY
jgi:hypothetical protein